MPRPQFTLRALLVAMLVVAAFFGGMAVQRRADAPFMAAPSPVATGSGGYIHMTLRLGDGTEWYRDVPMDQ
jgi:hypothetical protein